MTVRLADVSVFPSETVSSNVNGCGDETRGVRYLIFDPDTSETGVFNGVVQVNVRSSLSASVVPEASSS